MMAIMMVMTSYNTRKSGPLMSTDTLSEQHGVLYRSKVSESIDQYSHDSTDCIVRKEEVKKSGQVDEEIIVNHDGHEVGGVGL